MERYNREKEQVSFVDKIILQLPQKWGNTARAQHAVKAKKSLRDANLWLLDLQDAIKGVIDIGESDDGLILLSCDLSEKCRVIVSEWTVRKGKSLTNSYLWLDEKIYELCQTYGVRVPTEHDHKGIIARVSCSAWWLRGLRVAHAKRAEGAAIDAGLVSKRADIYVSDDTLERRAAQHKRNAETLANIKMMNTDTGDVMTLAAISKAGAASQENRRAELITRVKGFEELAQKYKHAAEFVTLTCPSRMHAVLANGKVNPKYDGTKPSEAQAYLVQCWARFRALAAKNKIKFYGLRIAEPHHDGTPHWHVILFYRKDAELKYKLRWAITTHFLADSADEAGAKENRVKFVAINPLKGSAAGYVLKYVLKNIGGIQDEVSDEAEHVESTSLYERVEAWAACWRIRQFQQVGGHYISVWRELRRVDESKLEGKRPNFLEAWKACQKIADKHADYAAYVIAMGGLETPPTKSMYMVDYDFITAAGRYGQTIIKKVMGVSERYGSQVLPTNRAEWLAV